MQEDDQQDVSHDQPKYTSSTSEYQSDNFNVRFSLINQSNIFPESSQSQNTVQKQIVRYQQQQKYQQQKKLESVHEQEYRLYFQEVEQEADKQMKSCLKNLQSRKQHKIVLLDQNIELKQHISFKKPVILIIGNNCGGKIVKYEILIGNYKLSLDLLNLQIPAPLNKKQLGYGTYGCVYRVNLTQDIIIASKRMNLKHCIDHKLVNEGNSKQIKKVQQNKISLEQIICEYAIYKICSFYNISPQIINLFGFDIIYFKNAIQFYIELCQSSILKFKNLEKEIKTQLRILHKLNIIHKDIKPANILYSFYYGKFVLSDFGISHSVVQEVGFLSESYKEGTQIYMSPDLVNIKLGTKGLVDLYYNDMYALKKTLQEYNKGEPKHDIKTMVPNKKNSDIDLDYTHILLFCLVLKHAYFTNIVKIISKYELNHLKYPLQCKENEYLIEIINFAVKHIKNPEKEAKLVNFSQKIIVKEQNVLPLYLRCYGLTDEKVNFLNMIRYNTIENIKKINNIMNINQKQYNLVKIIGNKQICESQLEIELFHQQQIANISKDYTKVFNISVNILRLKLENLSLLMLEEVYNILNKIEEYSSGQDTTNNNFIFKEIFQMIIFKNQEKKQIIKNFGEKRYFNFKIKKIQKQIDKIPTNLAKIDIYSKVLQVYRLKNEFYLFEYFSQKCRLLIQENNYQPAQIYLKIFQDNIQHNLFKHRYGTKIKQIQLLVNTFYNALQYIEKNKIPISQANLLKYKIIYFIRINNYEEAQKYSLELIDQLLIREGENSIHLAKAYRQMSRIQLKLKNYDKAQEYICKSNYIYDSYGEKTYYYSDQRIINHHILNFINLINNRQKKCLEYFKNKSITKDSFQKRKIVIQSAILTQSQNQFLKLSSEFEKKYNQITVQQCFQKISFYIQKKQYLLSTEYIKIIIWKIFQLIMSLNSESITIKKIKIEINSHNQKIQLIQEIEALHYKKLKYGNQILVQLVKFSLIYFQVFADFKFLLQLFQIISKQFFKNLCIPKPLRGQFYEALSILHQKNNNFSECFNCLKEQFKCIKNSIQTRNRDICIYKIAIMLFQMKYFLEAAYYFTLLALQYKSHQKIKRIYNKLTQCMNVNKKYHRALCYKVKQLRQTRSATSKITEQLIKNLTDMKKYELVAILQSLSSEVFSSVQKKSQQIKKLSLSYQSIIKNQIFSTQSNEQQYFYILKLCKYFKKIKRQFPLSKYQKYYKRECLSIITVTTKNALRFLA